jgi:hypothetical protein
MSSCHLRPRDGACRKRGHDIEFHESIRIRRSTSDVFAMMADIQEYAVSSGSPVVSMDKIPPEPTRVGTRWREVIRLGPRLTMTMWSEVIDLEPGRRLVERFWGGHMTGTLSYAVTPVEGGSILAQHQTLATVGWLRPLDRMIARMLRPRLSGRLQDIRSTLERPLPIQPGFVRDGDTPHLT